MSVNSIYDHSETSFKDVNKHVEDGNTKSDVSIPLIYEEEEYHMAKEKSDTNKKLLYVNMNNGYVEAKESDDDSYIYQAYQEVKEDNDEHKQENNAIMTMGGENNPLGRTSLQLRCTEIEAPIDSSILELIRLGGEDLVMKKDKIFGRTALHIACSYNVSCDLISELVDVGQEKLVMQKDKNGNTALILACKKTKDMSKKTEEERNAFQLNSLSVIEQQNIPIKNFPSILGLLYDFVNIILLFLHLPCNYVLIVIFVVQIWIYFVFFKLILNKNCHLYPL